ncbi:MAG: hypothetical protein KDA28_09410 [Phycisphaerales bacterium]|nr:hypothetical protein [Phycisphaerales bacterium]
MLRRILLALGLVVLLVAPVGAQDAPTSQPTSQPTAEAPTLDERFVGTWATDMSTFQMTTTELSPDQVAMMQQVIAQSQMTVTFGADGSFVGRRQESPGAPWEESAGTWSLVETLENGAVLQTVENDRAEQFTATIVSADEVQFTFIDGTSHISFTAHRAP